MAKKRKITVDKTEIVFIDTSGKRAQIRNLTYEKIMRIQFAKFDERKLLKKLPSEKIEIFGSGRHEPYVFTRLKNEDFFDEYKEKLAEFAKRNRVTFTDDTGTPAT